MDLLSADDNRALRISWLYPTVSYNYRGQCGSALWSVARSLRYPEVRAIIWQARYSLCNARTKSQQRLFPSSPHFLYAAVPSHVINLALSVCDVYSLFKTRTRSDGGKALEKCFHSLWEYRCNAVLKPGKVGQTKRRKGIGITRTSTVEPIWINQRYFSVVSCQRMNHSKTTFSVRSNLTL